MLRKLFGVAGVSSLLIAAPLTAGRAADMPLKAPPPPPPAFNWTGCYIDGGVGYGFWDQSHYAETNPGHVPLTPTANSGGEGWLGRVGSGCDYQTPLFNNRVIIGAFADYDFTNLKGTFQGSLDGFLGTENESGAWAAGGRIGYLVTPTLLTYFDAGYTQARFDSIALSTDTVPSFATVNSVPANTYHGWFIGGGTEYALSGFVPINGLFWRTEYRYADYQAADLLILPLATGAHHMQNDVQTITSGLVWRFNAGGPIAARY